MMSSIDNFFVDFIRQSSILNCWLYMIVLIYLYYSVWLFTLLLMVYRTFIASASCWHDSGLISDFAPTRCVLNLIAIVVCGS